MHLNFTLNWNLSDWIWKNYGMGQETYFGGTPSSGELMTEKLVRMWESLKESGVWRCKTVLYLSWWVSPLSLWSDEKQDTTFCPHCGREGTIPYYYIGLNSKLKLWCKDPEMCRKMTCHMKEKDHWFYENSSEDWGWEIKKRAMGWQEVFPVIMVLEPGWKLTLPVFCPDEKCRFVIHASDVEKEPFLPDSSLKKLVCPSCHKNFEHKPANAYGDPRNIAFYIYSILLFSTGMDSNHFRAKRIMVVVLWKYKLEQCVKRTDAMQRKFFS